MGLKLRLLEAGHCLAPEWLSVKGGGFPAVPFPASVALIEHPREGLILFDTGYSPRFHEQTRHFPERFYALATRVHIDPEATAMAQLKALGIEPGEIRKVIVSHFHADHVGGLGDFPRAEYLHLPGAIDALRPLGRWASVRAGFLRGLLPEDFKQRSRPLDRNRMSPMGLGLGPGYDLFGDGSLMGVPLPGHAPGHLGLLVQTEPTPTLLVADACWSLPALRAGRLPPLLTRAFLHDPGGYGRTFNGLRALVEARPDITIVPCHCRVALEALLP